MPLVQNYTEDMGRRDSRGDSEAPIGAQVLGLSREGAVFPSRLQRLSPYFAEFVGTFLLTMTFIYNYGHSRDPLWTATSNGLMVMALTYAFGHVSGANFNPSISLALLMAGRQSVHTISRLFLAQFLGAASAALLQNRYTNAHVDIGPNEGHSWRAVILIEIVYTAVLCFVYLNCAASTRNNPWHSPNGFVGLAVGFVFIGGGYAAREVSHTVMNSAIAVGLTVVDSKEGFSSSGIAYFFADLFGAFVATGLYRLVRPAEANFRNDAFVPELADGGPRAAQVQLANTGATPARGWSEKRPSRTGDSDAAKVTAEFIGTFVVIFTKALNRLGAVNDIGPEAWSVAAALTSMVYAVRGVSGAHFNPVVTLAAVLSGRSQISGRTAVFYIVAQVLAGIAASSMFGLMSHGKTIPLTFGTRAAPEAVIFAEGCFSFLVTYVVLAMSVPAAGGVDSATGMLKQNDIAGFAYGACQIAGGFSVGHISGAMMNPAVVLSFSGVNMLRGEFRGDVTLYIIWQAAGALLATGAFVVTHVRLYADADDMEDDKAIA